MYLMVKPFVWLILHRVPLMSEEATIYNVVLVITMEKESLDERIILVISQKRIHTKGIQTFKKVVKKDR